MDKKVVLITGASSGIGLASAKLLAGAGYKVYALNRKPFEQEGITYISTDITKEEQIDNALSIIAQKEGKIDILVNNAGMGIYGATEYTDPADARYLFDVNFFAPVRLAQKVLPLMRKAGGGRIINISSLAQVFCLPFQSFYSSSKAALSALFSALRSEVKPFNIQVVNIMPGDIATGFTDNRRISISGQELYAARIEKNLGIIERDERNGMSAESIARAVLKSAGARKPKPNVTVGLKYTLFYVLAKVLPSNFVNKIMYMMYGGE
ncbi:MAG: SDR family oxidoreductase [Christensenellales bacterium]